MEGIGGCIKIINLDINQTGPTCGIYSLANGLLNMNKVSDHNKEKIDQEIYELLKEFKFGIKDNKFTGYTLVGEFLNSIHLKDSLKM